MMFEPWQLAMLDDAGYNGIRDEHIDRVAESLLATGLTEIDRSTFDYHCHKCGIDPDNFTQADLDRLQENLNEYDSIIKEYIRLRDSEILTQSKNYTDNEISKVKMLIESKMNE